MVFLLSPTETRSRHSRARHSRAMYETKYITLFAIGKNFNFIINNFQLHVDFIGARMCFKLSYILDNMDDNFYGNYTVSKMACIDLLVCPRVRL